MLRLPQQPRSDWRERLNEVGFRFHSIDPEGVDVSATEPRFAYWREDVAYRFTEAQVETVHDATQELHAMCLALVERLIRRGELDRLALSPAAQQLVERSWRRQDPHLYGRFDLAWTGQGAPRLLEYNADTPTSLIETAVAQWQWLREVQARGDQFNSLHEALRDRLARIARRFDVPRLHLACQYDSLEDVGNVEYLLDVAVQAGWYASMLDMGEIGVLDNGRYVDADDQPISACFKLYPWEWMVDEPLGAHLMGPAGAPADKAQPLWLEPPWKMALSNKALLALLWEAHPGHPNLLPTYLSPEPFGTQAFVSKPFLSREGANVQIRQAGTHDQSRPGPYGSGPRVYQAHAPLASFPAPETTFLHGPLAQVWAVLGSWVVADEAVGLCVREDIGPITGNSAYFVPHYFD